MPHSSSSSGDGVYFSPGPEWVRGGHLCQSVNTELLRQQLESLEPSLQQRSPDLLGHNVIRSGWPVSTGQKVYL